MAKGVVLSTKPDTENREAGAEKEGSIIHLEEPCCICGNVLTATRHFVVE